MVEDESVGKKRMIHDATHGVRVNHRIRCRDKIRAAGAREKKQLLREMMEARQVAFSVVGDIAKAHRRFKHWVEEHGYLGCQKDATLRGRPGVFGVGPIGEKGDTAKLLLHVVAWFPLQVG